MKSTARVVRPMTPPVPSATHVVKFGEGLKQAPLIERIDFDGATGTLSFAFRLPGFASLTAETSEKAS